MVRKTGAMPRTGGKVMVLRRASRGERLHIAIMGRRNAGKSSLINALTNQEVALVSPVPGTTTDPVYKSMELLPVGPVVIIDTAGLDDLGDLGQLRVKRSRHVLSRADMVLLLVDATAGWSHYEAEILQQCRENARPVLLVLTKVDLGRVPASELESMRILAGREPVQVSAVTGEGVHQLKLAIIQHAPPGWDEQPLVSDLVAPQDVVVLVTPIDAAAPKGRLILPQVQTLRDLLDRGAMALVTREHQFKQALERLSGPPCLVITDSQVFAQVNADTPATVPLTSFSILYARYKGDLPMLLRGAGRIDELKPGDRVLVAESCTHHRAEDDIGTVKIPRWLTGRVGGPLRFAWSSGSGFPGDLEQYRLIVHCGGCMINRREMTYRLALAQAAGVPVVNYGVCIAKLQGILPRALSPFPEAASWLAGLSHMCAELEPERRETKHVGEASV